MTRSTRKQPASPAAPAVPVLDPPTPDPFLSDRPVVPPGKPLIEVEDLHKSFGGLHVLRGITTTIKKGEVVVVIGPSGGGKSTFLRCLNLLETPTSGRIWFGGEDIVSGDGGLYLLREGESMYTFNLPVYTGVNRETGLGEYWIDPADQSKGKTSSYTQAGSAILGKGLPDITGGMTNTLTYKNFDLSCLISYQFGAKLFDYMEYFTVSHGQRAASFNQLAKGADYWTPNNKDAKYPKPIYGSSYRYDRWSSFHVKSTDNIRVREITLGYTQPFKRAIESLRVYVKATNPFMIWSATPDVDPDVPINGYRTVDIPATRSFVAGVNIRF